MTRVLYGTMMNGSSKNHKVKQLSVFTIFPQVVNQSQSFLNPLISKSFLKMLVRSAKIEWSSAKEGQKCIMQLVNLLNDFIKIDALKLYNVIDDETSKILQDIFRIFYPLYKNASEQIKKESLRTTFIYLSQIAKQILTPSNIDITNAALVKMEFLSELTEKVLPLCKDYWDSVRESACAVLVVLSKCFIYVPDQPTAEQKDLMQMIQASI